jgi:hypothetical protein
VALQDQTIVVIPHHKRILANVELFRESHRLNALPVGRSERRRRQKPRRGRYSNEYAAAAVRLRFSFPKFMGVFYECWVKMMDAGS